MVAQPAEAPRRVSSVGRPFGRTPCGLAGRCSVSSLPSPFQSWSSHCCCKIHGLGDAAAAQSRMVLVLLSGNRGGAANRKGSSKFIVGRRWSGNPAGSASRNHPLQRKRRQIRKIGSRALSSAERAPGLHPGCRRFDSVSAHQIGDSLRAGAGVGLAHADRRHNPGSRGFRLQTNPRLRPGRRFAIGIAGSGCSACFPAMS